MTEVCTICDSKTRLNADCTCINAKGCNERRCARRQAEDRLRTDTREQCYATTGSATSTRFCTLRTLHKGLHLHGTKEWSGDYEAPAAQRLRALQAFVRETREQT
jgi:hypothetical protein